VEAVKGKR